jgi:O-antigen/teichoic acid export membrane protein
MITAIGLSVLTQMLASGGSFIVTILMLRLLSLDLFGLYVYASLFAGFCSQIVNAACGSVYHLLRPRLEIQRRPYERSYNALHLLLIAAAVAASAAACLASSPQLAGAVGVTAVGLFILAVTALESLKLQATANGRHRLIALVELARQPALIGVVGAMAWQGTAGLLDLMLVHASAGLLACAAIMAGIGWRPSFRRLGWAARRHFLYARYLVPSAAVSTCHSFVVWLLAGYSFGPQALGVLRAAELPFNVLNPLKSSLAYFLPRAIHEVERASGDRTRFLRHAAVLLLLLPIVCAALWALSIPAFPLLTGKEYPALVGLLFACAYVLFTLVAVTETYLNIIDRSDLVFVQTVVGAVAALLVYAVAAPLLGHVAAALAVAGATLAMALYGCARLVAHWRVAR